MLSTPVLEAASISTTSGEWPAEICRARDALVARLAVGAVAQLTAFASRRAALVLPVPRGPQNR